MVRSGGIVGEYVVLMAKGGMILTEVERCGGCESLLDGEGGFGLGGMELLRGGLWALD